MGTMAPDVDVLVIGAGPGGYVAAIRAAQLGKRVVVVDKEFLGGVCLNVGCIPSKALISASRLYRRAHEAQQIGITFTGVSVDWAKVQAWKRGVVKKMTDGVSGLLKGNGVQVLIGDARLTGPQSAEVRTKEGAAEKVQFKSCILATGSRPIEIPGFKFDGRRVLSSTEALELPRIPKSLVIIGGGAIGLEVACFYANFGSKITVVELLPHLVPGTDAELAKTMDRLLRKRGVDIHLEAQAKQAVPSGDGVRVTFAVAGREQTVDADHCLVAVGRRANVQNLGLEAAGVKIHEKGFIPVDAKLRTNVAHIYAIGDLVGPPQLAHKASKEGIIAAEVLAGQAAERDFASIPGVIFTDPEIATAGLSEEEARKAGHDVGVGRFPFSANGRAMTALETDGFAKVVFDRKTRLLLGVHIIGPEATDLISEAALALEMGATAEDLAMTVHPHPTLGEVVMEAAEDAEGKAIHILKRAA